MAVEGDAPPAVPAVAVEPAVPPTPPAAPPPRMIGQWEVEKQIGRGSFAVVGGAVQVGHLSLEKRPFLERTGFPTH